MITHHTKEFSKWFLAFEHHELFNKITFDEEFVNSLVKLWKEEVMLEVYQKYQDVEFHVSDGCFKFVKKIKK
jgi:hypothetical protein